MKTSYRIARYAAILFACFAITSIWGSSGMAEPPATEAAPKTKIPSILADFVKANNDRDTDYVTACFSKDAVVYDAGHIMRGPAKFDSGAPSYSKNFGTLSLRQMRKGKPMVSFSRR